MKTTICDILDHPMVTVKVYENGLSLIKYKRKVFYKGTWDEATMNARGLVIDSNTEEVVHMPFTKVFNVGENGTEIDPELEVMCPRKINGFFACASWRDGKVLISTTGSLDSKYVEYARHYLDRRNIREMLQKYPKYNCMFEIVHPEDPHIVNELPGAYLIGMRSTYLGSPLVREEILDQLGNTYGIARPECWVGKFKDIPLDVDHEGWMVRDFNNGECLAKLKSKHYLFKKFWMRSKKAYNIQEVEEEYFDLVTKIRETFTEEEWGSLTEQHRRLFLELHL